MTDAELRQFERVLDQSGIVPELEQAITNLHTRPGRTRRFPVKALLIGLMLSAREGSMHLIGVHTLLNDLPKATKDRLGINRAGGITRRQVQSLYGAVCRSIGGQTGLDDVCRKLIEATLPDDLGTTSIAIDSTAIHSWGRRRRTKTGKIRVADRDARWRGQKTATPWKLPVFGYDLTVAATVPEYLPARTVRAGLGPDVPLVVTSMRFQPANRDVVKAGVAVAAETAAFMGQLGDVIVDRGYTAKHDGTDFLLPIRAMGGEPIFDLYDHQRGVTGTSHGALIIDGQPHSPACPQALHNITPPSVSATSAEKQAYQAEIARRARYALKPHGSRKSSGAQDYQCPAAAGQLNCRLVPSSRTHGPHVLPALNAPMTVLPMSVCSKKYTRFAAGDIPLSQRELYGTHDWYQSFQRRNRVEGVFGNLKNEACENLKRGTIRVMGLVKTGLMVAISIATMNLRLLDLQAARKPKPVTKRRGRPRKNPLQVHRPAAVAVSIAGANAPPG